MTPQIIGTKKSKDYRACERYCKERSITFQARDPIDAPLSPGEIDALLKAVSDPVDLIDTASKAYQKKGLAWMEYDPVEEITENPQLLRQPIVRTDSGIAIAPDRAQLDNLFQTDDS